MPAASPPWAGSCRSSRAAGRVSGGCRFRPFTPFSLRGAAATLAQVRAEACAPRAQRRSGRHLVPLLSALPAHALCDALFRDHGHREFVDLVDADDRGLRDRAIRAVHAGLAVSAGSLMPSARTCIRSAICAWARRTTVRAKARSRLMRYILLGGIVLTRVTSAFAHRLGRPQTEAITPGEAPSSASA